MQSQPQHTQRTSETLHDVAGDVIQLLTKANEKIAVAESLTGGGVMAALTSVPGASAVIQGGVVSYATPLKQQLLKVNADLIARDGVVNGPVAEQMAAGVREITSVETSTTWGLSTTGVAGPTRQDGHPVGTVFIGIASSETSQAWGPFCFPGDRERIRQATVLEGLVRLREMLSAKASKAKDAAKEE